MAENLTCSCAFSCLCPRKAMCTLNVGITIKRPARIPYLDSRLSCSLCQPCQTGAAIRYDTVNHRDRDVDVR